MKSSMGNAQGAIAPLLFSSSLLAFLAILYLQIDTTYRVIVFSVAVGVAVVLGSIRMATAENSGNIGNQRGKPQPLSYTSGFATVDENNRNSSSKSTSASSSNSAVLATKRAYQKEGKDGIIVKNKLSHMCIAIEFYGPAGFDGKSVEVEFVQSSNLNPAKVFLQGETYKVVDLDNGTFGSFRAILMQNSRSTGRIDVASGCAIYEGIVP